MRRAERSFWIIVLTVTTWLFIVPPAHAYVDPGSTSLIFAWLVAAVGAAAMTFRIGWRRLRRLFGSAEPDDRRDHASPQSLGSEAE